MGVYETSLKLCLLPIRGNPYRTFGTFMGLDPMLTSNQQASVTIAKVIEKVSREVGNDLIFRVGDTVKLHSTIARAIKEKTLEKYEDYASTDKLNNCLKFSEEQLKKPS
jgi:hypothetical protein